MCYTNLIREYFCRKALKFISHNYTFSQVTETVSKLFADIVVRLGSDMIPQNIKSYTVRSGQDEVDITGIESSNPMEPLHVAGFRKALRQILEKTMNTNVKVKINQAIKSIKVEASA